MYTCCTVTVIVSLTQTPSPVVCPGDELVFTCVGVINASGAIIWRRNDQSEILQYGQTIPSIPDFILNITSYNNITTELVSTATRESATVQLDGVIGCSDDGLNYMTLTIDIAGQIQYGIVNDSFKLLQIHQKQQ